MTKLGIEPATPCKKFLKDFVGVAGAMDVTSTKFVYNLLKSFMT